MMLILFSSMTVLGQKPPKVHSIVKQLKTFEWYKEAAKGWKKVLDENPNNPEGWLNYYTANRMARHMFPQQIANENEPYLENLNLILENALKNIPNTFEYYYLLIYNNRTFDEEFEQNLLKAYELGKDRVEVYDDLVSYFETKRDKEKVKEYTNLWYSSGDVSPGLLSWNYNVLQSLEPNSVLIANGDNDTFPIMILQQVFNLRPDVLVLNINLLTIDSYREKVFQEFDFGNAKIDDTKLKDDPKAYLTARKMILESIIANLKGKNFYYALTCDPHLYEDMQNKVYMIGLALKYSENDFDNMAFLIKNFEQNWLMDYVKMNFINDISEGVVNQVNTNYLPVLAKLYNHFTISKNETKINEIKNLANTIAKRSNSYEFYKQLFENEQK